jgi:CBS domain-containing protein
VKFFTAGDILAHQSAIDLTDPVTIELEDTIYDALSLMFDQNFSQIPVMSDGRVAGAVTFKSVSRVLKSVPNTNIERMSVKGGTVTPKFVSENQDVFELFETFAQDEYVLIGDRDDLRGILTRYDVFYFLKDQFEPFILIGEVERSLRQVFRNSADGLNERIQTTFQPRTEDDPSYSVPDSIHHFNFEEYKRFISSNLDTLPAKVESDRDFILELLEQVRANRNALVHFRSGVDEIDREVLEVAHSYFTGLAE